uniref:Neurotrophin-3 n=1 Tax=Neogobius melanostomus TaxID=47308 RepID=A0A8C6U6L3_9GOBI
MRKLLQNQAHYYKIQFYYTKQRTFDLCLTAVLLYLFCWQVLQVNLVMSILLYVMVLVYLYGVQVTNTDHTSGRQQHKRYHSPRVLLSDRPPGMSEGGNRTRKKRYAAHRSYRGEYSVCDSQSRWVTDRTEAVDDRGSPVTVLATIRTNAREDIKQYFFETRCQSQRPSKGGCRGIDNKNWNSQCKTTQTFVRALTQVRNAVGWRWIRIDTSCVCALSRKRRRT